MQILYPTVRVIMPVRNEAAFIERSMQAVLAQDYPHEYMEAIVADGMSTDSTRDIVQFIQAQHPNRNLRLIDNRGRTASARLNVAMLNSPDLWRRISRNGA